ncbi:hypothetical protein BASA50_011285 [Batrachochytrium salamandrivorans]|uniref:LIM zinc-binding domain-containing protein n=1 Tax=Batrachochytrium salamandrivorans TaxID=1357716 RepID=A0ABQ8EW72_9FUNG|nr:hypothetical protein BASA60_007868 [Batrachochytrium salamandrivorans]KAH6580804.1 hypothetical protein BASA61_009414 [Batrachochytrium salamandrivorans]KAH6587681.1 hypothetical protein BASA50_011285 [Batrachochytrium salamandrivorans]KAH6602273.1 hypothetical protein BASA61_001331 [Batrachochytrium salamandrivorans]KAH9274564.1 hypothetical protein BASA83_003200 [Batrachochytrium salamandrivorans]
MDELDALDALQNSLKRDLACVNIDDFKGHCKICQEPVTGNTVTQYTQDGVQYLFHKDCFKCEMCQSFIGSTPFYLHETKHCFKCSTCHNPLVTTYVEKDGAFMCKDCYEAKFLPMCNTCNGRIFPAHGTGTIVAVEWKDKKFHQACFVCKVCAKPFVELKAVAHNDTLYCKECFEDEATRNAS